MNHGFEISIFEITNLNSHIFNDSDQGEDSDDNIEDTNEVNENANESRPELRPQKTRQVPSRLENCKMLPNSAINDNGEIFHFALLVDVEPLNYKAALETDVRKKSMIEDVNAIKNNHIWVMVELLEKKEIIDAK
jgi:hypothetical protein